MKDFKNLFVIMLMTLLSLDSLAEDIILKVNGKGIDKRIYDHMVKDAIANGQKGGERFEEAVISKLIDSELVYQEAQKLGLDMQSNSNETYAKSLQDLRKAELIQDRFNLREELLRRELITSIFLKDFVNKNPVSEVEAKAAYEEYKKAYGEMEYLASHILVNTQGEANNILSELAEGGNFEKIAKEKSQDIGSNQKGGDLGWFSPATMVPPFREVVTNLPKGIIANIPVQTQFGWHVIKLIDSRTAQTPAYNKVSEALKKNLQQRNFDKMITELRSKASIEYNVNPNNSAIEEKKTQQSKTPMASAMDLESAKKSCSAIGFKPKTEKFGNCVLELTK